MGASLLWTNATSQHFHFLQDFRGGDTISELMVLTGKVGFRRSTPY
jgi:hypothetical protein